MTIYNCFRCCRSLLAATFVACLAASAQPIQPPQVIGLHLYTVHSDPGGHAPGALGWNKQTLGIYARWGNGFTTGAFRNSLYRNSIYAGWTFSDRADRFALTLGVVSGYDRIANGIGDHQAVRCEQTCRVVDLRSVYLPLVVPSVRVPITENTSARLALVWAPGQPAAAHLSVERRF